MAKQFKLASTIMALVAAMIWTMPTQVSFAAEAAATNTAAKEGFGSGLTNAISDFQSRLPAVFHEPAAADVGNKPRLKTRMYTLTGYTSNGNLDSNQASSAWLARVSPGLSLEMPIGDRLYTEIDYTYSFATIQGRNIHENTNSHHLQGLARYALTDATQLGLKQSIQWSELPGTSAGNMFTLNSTTAEITHRFSDILDAYLSDTYQWFQDETESDEGLFNQQYNDNGVAGGVNYEVTDRITLTPNAGWNIRNFAALDSKDYWQARYQLNGKYELGTQTTLTGFFGHNIRNFSKGSGADDTENNLIWGAGIINNVTHKLSVDLDYTHNAVDTFDTGFLNSTTAEATNADNLDRNFRIMTTHRIKAGTNYYINEKNRVSLWGDLQFVNAAAEDNVVRLNNGDEVTMEFGPTYSYRINEYMNLDVAYTFGRRMFADDSGGGSNRSDYTFNKATAGLNFAL